MLEAAAAPTYVVVCRGPHCREKGSLPLRRRLGELLRSRHDEARLVGYHCFGQCERGPNVAFYPEGVWYGGLIGVGDAERVVQHALGSQPMRDAPLRLPEQERREHLANIAELVSTLERDGRPRGSWWRRWWPVRA